MRQHLKYPLISVCILAFVLTCFPPSLAHAEVISDASLVQPTIPNTFSVTAEQTGDYLNPVNSFSDGNPTYIFITQNSSKAGTTSLSFEGVNYSVTTLISNGNDLTSNNGITHLADSVGNILRSNVTIFFDDGTYNNADSSDYYGFSEDNLSLVGLHSGNVIIKKSPRSDGTMERTGFQNKNIYLENIIFDGRNINMYSSGTGSRGQYFFFLSGGGSSPFDASSGFVMRNCTIQNVGSSSSLFTNKNVGINIYQSSGQHNFENVTFNNVMTQLTYGIISLNDAKDNYFKNISITNDSSHASSSSSFSLKIEKTSTTLIPATSLSNVFSGALLLPSTSNRNFVYLQDFNYGKTVLPANYRYAQYRNSNGSDSSSAIRVFQTVIPAIASNYAILDLKDNSWLVQAASPSRTISNQLSDILAVKTGMNSAGAIAKWPLPNIKISANSLSEIGSFSIPSFASNNVNIVAVPTADTLFSSKAKVPFSAGATISGNAAVNSLHLFNFDFDTKAHYTLQELTAHRGLNYVTLTDPNESGSIPGYPKYSTYGYLIPDLAPLFPNVSSSSFGNCVFTSLTKEIEISLPSSSSVAMGYSLPLAAALKVSTGNSYTGSGFTGNIQNTADDLTIDWFSTNPSIASVDQHTGVVTGVSSGTVTIFAKSMDANNQGEIEKPFAQIQLTVRPQSHSLGLTLVSSVEKALRGDKVIFTFTITNPGLDPNPSTFFTNTLPTNFNILDVVADRGTLIILGNNINLDLGTMAPGESVELTITTEIDKNSQTGFSVTNIGTVSTMGDEISASAEVNIQLLSPASSAGAGQLTIPITGFAPGQITQLPSTSASQIFEDLGDLWLEIPSQNIKTAIVGVPKQKDGWDVSWLGSNAGFLEGSAYPTLDGNSVITAHNYLSSGLPGPFVNIKALKYGDAIVIHAFGKKYTYLVQQVETLYPKEITKVFKHTTFSSLTLLTCNQFDVRTDTYLQRIAVRAVLLKVE
ncbi:MAG: sortase [Anaerolineaceae bacterium]